MEKRISIISVLNGMSLAIAIALLPGAILGELSKFINSYHEIGGFILKTINFCSIMLPFTIGVCVAQQHKLDTIQTISVGFAMAIGSGIIKNVDGGTYSLAGTGDVINSGLTAIIATFLIMKFCRPLKSLSVIITPMIVPIMAGTIGILCLPYVSLISKSVGDTINYFTTLQPVLMGSLIAMAFTIIIVSPISTVGIAAAAANTGVSVAGVVLAQYLVTKQIL